MIKQQWGQLCVRENVLYKPVGRLLVSLPVSLDEFNLLGFTLPELKTQNDAQVSM